MKLKEQPDDFQVEELTDIQPGEGPFAFYRLSKVGWATLDALQAIRRRWKLDRQRLSYGGLKDRHARTVQYFSVFHGPQRNLTHHGVHVEYLGRIPHPYTSHHILANQFLVVLRGLSVDEVPAALFAADLIRLEGVPNYFDDQRFGSVGSGRDFVARFLLDQRYEDALRLALTASYAFDRAEQKREKSTLLSHWGQWVQLKELLPRGHARSLVDYLVGHPTDFKGAAARLRPDLRTLYVSAYQSYLWNKLLASWLQGMCRSEQLLQVSTKLGQLPMTRGLNEEQRKKFADLVLPLPSSRLKLPASDPLAALYQTVLGEEGLTLEAMRFRGLRDLFFSKGDRPGLCLPRGLECKPSEDDLHHGQQKLTLKFQLPRGSYATLILKRIQSTSDS